MNRFTSGKARHFSPRNCEREFLSFQRTNDYHNTRKIMFTSTKQRPRMPSTKNKKTPKKAIKRKTTPRRPASKPRRSAPVRQSHPQIYAHQQPHPQQQFFYQQPHPAYPQQHHQYVHHSHHSYPQHNPWAGYGGYGGYGGLLHLGMGLNMLKGTQTKPTVPLSLGSGNPTPATPFEKVLTARPWKSGTSVGTSVGAGGPGTHDVGN